MLLIGDAAHPTSPVGFRLNAHISARLILFQHLGQGANQAFEDVDLLIELLEKHNPTTQPPSTKTLGTIFSELEAVRIPRSSAMVQGARAQGETRVVQGVEACKARNDTYRRDWSDPDAMMEKMVVSLQPTSK